MDNAKTGRLIRERRSEMGLTQKELAGKLHITDRAVSQWESDKTVPDYSLLVPLADFFDISLDELLGRAPGEKEKAIGEYNDTDTLLASEGKTEAQIAMWREALKRFPGDFHCMNMLASSLFLNLIATTEGREEKARECVSLCERILRDCTETDARESAVQTLVFLYSMPDLSFADEKKAAEYAEKGGNLWVSSQILLERAYYTGESRTKRVKIRHGNRLLYLSLLTDSLVYDRDLSPEEHLAALECALKLYKTVLYDENYLFCHCRLADIYFFIARIRAERKNRQETLDAIEKMLFHAHSYDLLPPGEVHYTSRFLRSAVFDAGKTSRNYSGSLTGESLNRIRQKEFDFLQNDPGFLALTEAYRDPAS